MKMLFAITAVLCMFGSVAEDYVLAANALLSPDGKVQVDYGVKELDKPYDKGQIFYYSVTFNGKKVLTDSPLGMEFKDMPPFGKDIEISGVEKKEIKETYECRFGKSSKVNNHCNEIKLILKEKEGGRRVMGVYFRAYDDGVAFRYYFPEQPAFKDFQLTRELSTFHFLNDCEVFAATQEGFIVESSWQERPYLSGKLSKFKPASFIIPPLLVKIADNSWAAIMEANLTDYAGLFLCGRKGFRYAIETKLSPRHDDKMVLVKATTPHFSPWRVIMLGEKPGDLIESNLVLNLNEPSVIEDVSWIKPGMAAWSWWCNNYIPNAGFKTGYNNETMKYFIDFAGEMGFEYMLVDEGWSEADDITRMNGTIDIPGLVEYGKKKGIDILLWARWPLVDRQVNEAFPLYSKWGVKGVKVDFMERNDQEMVNFYHRVLKKAVENKLTINFHGGYVPTGIRRTYPNLITNEAVRGNEYNKFEDSINMKHLISIPFTRMLCGPMDFTPGSFSNVTEKDFWPSYDRPVTRGTRCSQLALFVIYESPIQSVCDAPDNYRNQPGAEFLKVVPTVWDETRVIDGKVGEYIVMARRSGNEWFIGAITDKMPRSFDIPLGFLGEGGYKAKVFIDGKDAARQPKNVEVKEIIVNSKDNLKAELSVNGGYSAYLYPINKKPDGK